MRLNNCDWVWVKFEVLLCFEEGARAYDVQDLLARVQPPHDCS